MNILVLATAATEGGALTILNNLYEDVKSKENKDKWFFACSYTKLTDSEHIKILKYPEAKKSWPNRLYFDKVTLEKIVKDNNIDLVLSLQNTLSKNPKLKQVLYMHQPLPFVERRYSIFEDKTFWLYQNVIYRFIKKSLKKSDLIIVQSQWMKDAIFERVQRERDSVVVSHPQLDISKLKKNNGDFSNRFFYPSGLYSYKNHKIILEALKSVNEKYSVDLTLDVNDPYTKELSEIVERDSLSVNFLGSIPYSAVCERYASSTLIFASEIETFGLPLLEARLSNSIVLALKTPFSKEILAGYKNAYLFETADELSELINKVLSKEITNVIVDEKSILNSRSLFDEINDYKNSL